VRLKELAAGRIVGGRYTVKAAIGRTPWACTYAALTEPNRDVVLTIVEDELVSHEAAEAELRRVRDTVRALPEHLVVPWLGDGVDKELHTLYLVAPRTPEPTLAELVEICPLPPAEAAAFLRSLAQALDAAHAYGLLHLALAPSRVFVGPMPKYAVHVGEFASAVLRAHCKDPRALAFDAAWAAPEIAQRGEAHGATCDVFSAALLAFFAMTRESFWRSRPAGSETAQDLSAWLGEVSAPRSSAAARARELGVELPDALDAVFVRALAASPTERFTSVGELADAFSLAVDPAYQPAPRAPLPSRPRLPEAHDDDGAVALSPASEAEEPRRSSLQARVHQARNALRALDVQKRRVVVLVAGGAVVFLLLFIVVGALAARGKPDASAAPSASVAAADPSTRPSEPAAASSTPPATPPDSGVVVVVCTPECDRVLVDGRLIGASPVRLVVAAGAHAVDARRNNYVRQERRVVVAAGDEQTVTCTLVPVAAPRPAAPPAPQGVAPAGTPKKRCGKFLERCD
jgi:serine/threonine protein kinase